MTHPLVKQGGVNFRESISNRRSRSPKLSSSYAFAPKSSKILPSEKIQEIFLSCIESVLKTRSRTEI